MNYEIEIHPAAVKYEGSSTHTILEAALSNKLFLEHSCKKGACGLCSATLVLGSVKNEQGQLMDSGTILTCCSYPQSNLILQASFCPELTSIECVTLPCKVASRELVTDDIIVLTLRLPPTAQFNYLPGQYIDLIYQGVRRSYSIANAQAIPMGIELHIRLIKDGEFSQLVLDSSSGQLMRLEGPKGTFFVREATNPIIFLAGGTGFAPIKAMVESLLANKVERTLYIYWGMVNSKHFYTDVAKSWAEQYKHVHYIPVVSAEEETWVGRKGFVHDAVIEDFSHLREYHVYACGSSLMINKAKETFVIQGLEEAYFFADAFVPSK